MVWNASLGGNDSPETERKVAAGLVAVAAEHNASVSFWTSNTPIDLDAIEDEPDAPAKADESAKERGHAVVKGAQPHVVHPAKATK